MSQKILIMFSGGLDSVMAAHVLKSQGLDVTALHFVLPFYAGIGRHPNDAQNCADKIGVPLMAVEEGEEFLEMMREPKFGFGKNANPCVDCRVHRLQKAARIMEDMGAICLATGEVAGQRPMSQKLPTLLRVEKLSGLKRRLLRPLSAKLLPPTIAEELGIVDREKLFDISGRSRAVQLAYAKEHNLLHGAPAGGCILTNIETGARFLDLHKHDSNFSLTDFKLIAYGRHFRASENFRVIVSRDKDEGLTIDKIIANAQSSSTSSCKNNCVRLHLRDATGPMAVGIWKDKRDDGYNDDLRFAASCVVRFSKLRDVDTAAVVVKGIINGVTVDDIVNVSPITDAVLDTYRVAAKI